MRRKKLKMIFDFYKYDYLILLLFCISTFLLLKTIDYYYLFNWKWLKIFEKFKYGNDIVLNLSIGFIGSAIFYLVNIFLPKIESFSKYNEIIKWNIEVIYNKLTKIFIMILNEEDIKKVQDCAESKLKENIQNVDPEVRFQYNGVENNINKEIESCYYLVLKHAEYLINFHGIVPVELLIILIKIKAPGIMLNMSMIGKTNKNNFRNFQDDLMELFVQYKEIALFKEVFIDKVV